MSRFITIVDQHILILLQGEIADPIRIYDGIKYGPTDPDLIKLATRVLSICCNSASCERLFSMFGNTLTKRRARLGMQAMTDQAELRLFLRDEHLKHEAEKKRRKRQTTSHSPIVNATPLSSTAAQTLPAPPAPAETETDAVNDDTEDENAESTRQSTATRLQSIFTSMSSASEEMEAEDLRPGPAAAPLAAATKVPLSELFDFSNAYWKKADSRISKRSIDDELELYQMLDLDAEGDIDDFDAADNLSHPDMIL